MNLRTLCFNIWKNKYERKGIASDYKPVFIRYIGVEDEQEYPKIIKTLYDRSKECEYSVFFDGDIPMQAEFDIINYVGNELKTMDVTNLKSQDITLFDNPQLNGIFLESIDTIVNLVIKQESFSNDSVRNNFILQLIVWTYLYIRPMSVKFRDDESPKCFYYGDIGRHQTYFLMMLYLMTFDVVYINPLKDGCWEETDTMHLSELHSDMHIMPVTPLKEIVENSEEISQENSITLQLQQEMDNTLFNGSGTFRPWQFTDGYTKAKFIKGTVFDVQSKYPEPAKVRDGFSVNGKTVTVPNLVYQINGAYSDMNEYEKFVRLCISAPNACVKNNGTASAYITGSINEQDRYQLAFCQNSDGTFDIEKVKELPFYPWAKYRDTLEDFMLKKINEALTSGIYNKSLSQQEQFDYICDILCMSEDIIRYIDGFDFTDKIPKIVVFLDGQATMDDKTLYILGYLAVIGMDVIIFSPAGLFSMDSVISKNKFNDVRLDEMRYDCTLDKIKQRGRKGLFAKIFGTK